MLEPGERPPIATSPISLVVPVHNAAGYLESTVDGWAAFLGGLDREWDILIVDDGSADGTGPAAEALARRHSQIRFLRHETCRGLGAALRTGIEAARLPLLAYVHGVQQYQPADLGRLLKDIDRVDLMAGYRIFQAGEAPRWWPEHAYRWLLRLLFGLRMRDPGCWFLLARRAIFGRIPIQSDGFFAHAEILAKANFLGCWMNEAPVAWTAGAPDPTAGYQLGRATWAELRHVFSRPNFGPAVRQDEGMTPAALPHGEIKT
jgi:glycosyltransferase involved in cell wall biosynthesis